MMKATIKRKRTNALIIIVLGITLLIASCSAPNESSDGSVREEDSYEYGLSLESITGSKLNCKIPENLLDDDGPLSKEDIIEYPGNDDSCKVIITGAKDEAGLVYEYVWSIIINDISAGTEYKYDFCKSKDVVLVEAEEYPEYGEPGEIYVMSRKEADNASPSDIISTFSPAAAHDANGNPVESYYRIDGTTLIQGVELTNDTAYPVTIE